MLRRYCPGAMRVNLRKAAVKWLWLANPDARATSVRGTVEWARSDLERSMRRWRT